MVDAVTNNFGFPVQNTGANVGTWGVVLNNGIFSPLDNILGSTLPVTINVSDVSLTDTQFQNAVFLLSGTLTGDRALIVPLNFNSPTVACGGKFIVVNATAGAFNVTVLTAAAGSTGVTVPQGFACALYSDGTNVKYDNSGLPASVLTVAGNPNGFVAGTAGSVNTNASLVYDRTNTILYVCTTTGNAASAVWTAVNITVPVPPPQGYLTPSSDVDNVVITADSIAASTVYYTPYVGNSCPLFNGLVLVPTAFTQQALTLSASQAGSNIYDVYAFLDGSTFRIGFGPSWAAGSGGSVTAGSCARGTGVGGAAIQRQGGVWLNTASMTVLNGVTTYPVAALRGTAIGTVFIDVTQGQVTCHRSYGQSRKWGVWNFYNRLPVYLKAGDSTASWTYNSTTPRAANGNSANSLTVLSGLAEEVYNITAYRLADGQGQTVPITGIGWNATNAYSGSQGRTQSEATAGGSNTSSSYVTTPHLGIDVVTELESSRDGANGIFYGTEAGNLLIANWRA